MIDRPGGDVGGLAHTSVMVRAACRLPCDHGEWAAAACFDGLGGCAAPHLVAEFSAGRLGLVATARVVERGGSRCKGGGDCLSRSTGAL